MSLYSTYCIQATMNIEPKSFMHYTAHKIKLFIANRKLSLCNAITCHILQSPDMQYWWVFRYLLIHMHYSLHWQYIPAYSIINHKLVLPRSEITVCSQVCQWHGIYEGSGILFGSYQVIVEHARVMTGHGVHVCQVNCEALLQM